MTLNTACMIDSIKENGKAIEHDSKTRGSSSLEARATLAVVQHIKQYRGKVLQNRLNLTD